MRFVFLKNFKSKKFDSDQYNNTLYVNIQLWIFFDSKEASTIRAKTDFFSWTLTNRPWISKTFSSNIKSYIFYILRLYYLNLWFVSCLYISHNVCLYWVTWINIYLSQIIKTTCHCSRDQNRSDKYNVSWTCLISENIYIFVCCSFFVTYSLLTSSTIATKIRSDFPKLFLDWV